jgi:hypothetical protein
MVVLNATRYQLHNKNIFDDNEEVFIQHLNRFKQPEQTEHRDVSYVIDVGDKADHNSSSVKNINRSINSLFVHRHKSKDLTPAAINDVCDDVFEHFDDSDVESEPYPDSTISVYSLFVNQHHDKHENFKETSVQDIPHTIVSIITDDDRRINCERNFRLERCTLYMLLITMVVTLVVYTIVLGMQTTIVIICVVLKLPDGVKQLVLCVILLVLWIMIIGVVVYVFKKYKKSIRSS